MLDNILSKTRRIIPKTIFTFFQPAYHYSLSLLAAIVYGFPSRRIRIIAVTGTKGKSSTTEIINAILEEAGFKTALSNTIRYKVASESTNNKYKMSMPGRFFVQKLISSAVKSKCDYLILEMTSQGTIQYRHKFIELDALVFTNLSPEHIDSHGSYENYLNAKLQIAYSLSRSNKRPRIIIANKDDVESEKFLNYNVEIKDTFSISEPIPDTSLIGSFNKYNILAGIHLARILGVKEESINKAISNLKEIPGRVQFIDRGQDFSVIVDYAHTTDSLKKLYEAFDGKRKICVLGGTGGGRDNWKRKEMGKIADTFCDEIILTNEDPYDEDPNQIIADVAEGIINKIPKIIVDRREAISEGIKLAKKGDVLLITGKGTDPYIMGSNDSKISWSDAEVAREEINKSLNL